MTKKISNNPFSILNSAQTMLMQKLDSIFASWGIAKGAQTMTMPFLLPIQALADLGVYENFPHQALIATSLHTDGVEIKVQNNTIKKNHLSTPLFGLPSAACYAVYLYFKHQQLPPEGILVTILGQCCRKEKKYQDLQRLLSFHMREVVALGSQIFTEQHLITFSQKIMTLGEKLDIPLCKKPAIDPFYDPNSPRVWMQKHRPVKYEFIFQDLAIASINLHYNFFGERCAISIQNADLPAKAFTSCVAFGLERWLSVLYKRYQDWEKAIQAIEDIEDIVN